MEPLLWVVIASAVLSGFFSVTSFAIRTFRRGALEEALGGKPGRKRLEQFERHLTALRLTAGFCRALFNLVLVVAMLYLFEVPQHDWQRAVWVTAVAGGIIAVFGIAIPHAWAAHGAEKVLAATLSILMGFRYALYPVISLMQAFEVPVRRLSGASEDADGEQRRAKQEILQVATEGQAEGVVGAEEVRMIASVIAFGRMQAGQIMTPRTDIFAIPVETPWKDACRLVAEHGHSRVPVYEGDLDSIVGILYAKDLLQYAQRADEQVDLRAILRKPFFVPETKPASDLLREFRARKVHLAVVMDEYGGTAGLVSIEDVLEEIVGEIADEYDESAPAPIRRAEEGMVEVPGRMRIGELNHALGLGIPEDADYDTVAGLIFWELGYIPSAGEKLQAHGAQFTVLAADERRITKVRAEILKQTTSQ